MTATMPMGLPTLRATRRLRCAALGLCVLLQAAAPPPSPVQVASSAAVAVPSSGVARILRADLERDVHWLAHDERQGRQTGSPEAVEAARWLAERMREAGLAPLGDDETYLQRVPILRTGYQGAPRLLMRGDDEEVVEGAVGVDFERVSGAPPAGFLPLRVVRGEAELPEAPAAGEALLIDAPAAQARRWLEAKGQKDGAGWGLLVHAGARAPGRPGRPARPRLTLARDEAPEPASLRLRGPMLERALSGSLRELRVEVDPLREELPAYNVIGVLRGRGTAEAPGLAAEAVVFTAHYDHIGVRELPPEAEGAESPDRIFNGADDDASGCAAVLALARAFASGPPPARTLIFLLVTGEEVGLLGTHWYLDHPPIPLERTVCNLNFEMVGRPDALAGGPGRLWLTGHERSNLGAAFADVGLDVVADPRPRENFFQRSDNYAFALRGIVAQTLSSYDLHGDYHTVGDEAHLLDYEHMERAVRAAYLGARGLADGSIRPEWRPGGNPKR